MKRWLLCLFFALSAVLCLVGCADRGAAETEASPTPAPTVGLDAGAVVLDRCHIEYDRPEDYRVDIRIPVLREELAGARELNAQIAEDYDFYLNTPPEEYFSPAGCTEFEYPFLQIWYEVYSFDGLYEIVVRYQEYSLYGSGASSYNHIYCYDAEAGCAVPLEEFLCRVNVTEAEIAAAFSDAEGDGPEGKTLNDFLSFFFIDENKDIRIEPNQ